MQDIDDLLRVVDRECRLGDICKTRRVAWRKRAGLIRRFNQLHRAVRKLSHRANDFRVSRVTDQNDFQPLVVMPFRFHMHLGDERAGGIKVEHSARARILRNRFGYTVGREHDRSIRIRNFIQFLDKYGPLGAQRIDNEAVVDDFVPDIYRSAILFQRQFNDLYGAVNAGAEAAGRGQQNRQRRTRGNLCHGSVFIE